MAPWLNLFACISHCLINAAPTWKLGIAVMQQCRGAGSRSFRTGGDLASQSIPCQEASLKPSLLQSFVPGCEAGSSWEFAANPRHPEPCQLQQGSPQDLTVHDSNVICQDKTLFPPRIHQHPPQQQRQQHPTVKAILFWPPFVSTGMESNIHLLLHFYNEEKAYHSGFPSTISHEAPESATLSAADIPEGCICNCGGSSKGSHHNPSGNCTMIGVLEPSRRIGTFFSSPATTCLPPIARLFPSISPPFTSATPHSCLENSLPTNQTAVAVRVAASEGLYLKPPSLARATVVAATGSRSGGGGGERRSPPSLSPHGFPVRTEAFLTSISPLVPVNMSSDEAISSSLPIPHHSPAPYLAASVGHVEESSCSCPLMQAQLQLQPLAADKESPAVPQPQAQCVDVFLSRPQQLQQQIQQQIHHRQRYASSLSHSCPPRPPLKLPATHDDVAAEAADAFSSNCEAPLLLTYLRLMKTTPAAGDDGFNIVDVGGWQQLLAGSEGGACLLAVGAYPLPSTDLSLPLPALLSSCDIPCKPRAAAAGTQLEAPPLFGDTPEVEVEVVGRMKAVDSGAPEVEADHDARNEEAEMREEEKERDMPRATSPSNLQQSYLGRLPLESASTMAIAISVPAYELRCRFVAHCPKGSCRACDGVFSVLRTVMNVWLFLFCQDRDSSCSFFNCEHYSSPNSKYLLQYLLQYLL